MVGTRVLREHFPAGVMGPVTALIVDEHADFGGDEGRKVVEQVTNKLRSRKDELGLADIRSLTAPLGITEQAEHPFAGLDVPEETRKEAAERAAREHYVTDLGERAKVGTRIELVPMESPFSHRSLNSLALWRQAVVDALPSDMRAESQLYFTGTTASVYDLAVVMHVNPGSILFGKQVSRCLFLLVLIHAEERQTFVLGPSVNISHLRDLHHTGQAPRCPKVNQQRPRIFGIALQDLLQPVEVDLADVGSIDAAQHIVSRPANRCRDACPW